MAKGKSLSDHSLEDLKRLVSWCNKKGVNPSRYIREIQRRINLQQVGPNSQPELAYIYDQHGHYRGLMSCESAHLWAEKHDGLYSEV